MTITQEQVAEAHGAPPPTLKTIDLTKAFGMVRGIKNINLQVARNEVVGLIGENGAGKSTLLKMLTGLYQPDFGIIEANGVPVRFRTPQDAMAAGIGVVHQEQSLLTNLSVAENLAMSVLTTRNRSTRFGWYRWKQLNEEAAQVLARVGAKVDPRTIVADLAFVDRQMVEIARAIRVEEMVDAAPLVILDEPTSVLERNETEVLEREIRALKQIGSVIFVSHRLDEVMRICDRIVVMREGQLVAERKTADVDEDELFRLMIGHESHGIGRSTIERGEGAAPVLSVNGLGQKGAFKDVSFTVAPGHCVAIVGTGGSGRESVCRAIFGAEPHDEGTIELDGKPVGSWSIQKAVRSGVAYVPSERRVEGMVGGMDAAENLTLAHAGNARRGPFLRPMARTKLAEEWFERLDVRPRTPALQLQRFSGGNQQKVVMAKWLQGANLKVLVLDHPLRGLDPGASEGVNDQIRAACDNGAAVVLLADTLEEALAMGHDILVMRDGEVTARFDLSVDSPTLLDLLERMV